MVGYTFRIGETRSTYTVLMGKPLGITRKTWGDNEYALREVGYKDGRQVVQVNLSLCDLTHNRAH